MKRILVLMAMMSVLMSTLMTGCGMLSPIDPDTVDEEYVLNKFRNELFRMYGVRFVIEITELDEDSPTREAVATAWPKDEPGLKCTISGRIEAVLFDGEPVGKKTRYHIDNDFDRVLTESIVEDLDEKYVLEIGGDANLEKVGENVENYIDDYLERLYPYRRGVCYDDEFKDNGQKRADVPLTLNGEDITQSIRIDTENTSARYVVVSANFSGSETYNVEIAEYLAQIRDEGCEATI
jgi:hypothetical protein